MNWYKIPGYKDEINKHGEVRNRTTRKIRSQHFGTGYKWVNVCDLNGKWVRKMTHILVARTFIGPCPSGKEVNHKDLDRSNNYYKNLEYTTHKENIQHGGSGERNGLAKLTWDKVKNIRKKYSTNNYYLRELAKEFNVHLSLISLIVRRKIWISKNA